MTSNNSDFMSLKAAFSDVTGVNPNNDFLFAVVTETLCGPSVGNISTESSDHVVPAFYASCEEAEQELQDLMEEASHDYDSRVLAVKWNDDDTIQLYSIDENSKPDDMISICSIKDAMGI